MLWRVIRIPHPLLPSEHTHWIDGSSETWDVRALAWPHLICSDRIAICVLSNALPAAPHSVCICIYPKLLCDYYEGGWSLNDPIRTGW
jgi:hypothetical protein